MKILGGNQVVFYPLKSGSYEIQLADCLEQLEEYMDEFQIYPGSFIRHNLFVKVTDWAAFSKIKPKLEHMAKRRFPLPMLINFIAAAPVHGLIALESTHVQSTQWNCLFKEEPFGACQHMKHAKTEVVLGSVKVNNSPEIFKNTEKAFETIDLLLSKCGMGFQHIVKQWNYMERMLDEDLGLQRYQIFNDLRTRFYDDDFVGIGYPASTEIGMTHGGIVIEFFAVKNREKLTRPIDNPLQKAPHEYSAEVLSEKGAFSKALPTTPKVERAQYLTLNKLSMVFVSSTAAMVGERVISIGNVKEQTDYIIEIFKKMLSEQHLKNSGVEPMTRGHHTLLKAYVKLTADFDIVEKIIDANFTKIPIVMIQADLPRHEMLVELETEMLF
jgi:enamine deaminase RidA (YjgF/YER057c/UK114 family)